MEMLDGILAKSGLEGLVKADCHWLCFCRRHDLHPDCVPVAPTAGSAISPNDVILQAKRFMSDSELSQPPFVMLRAGASVHLHPPTGPSNWVRRKPIENAESIERLCRKLSAGYPSRTAAVTYLQQWLASPREPLGPPAPSPILAHRYGVAVAGKAVWQVFGDALRPEPVPEAPLPQMVVKRRRGSTAGRQHVSVALPEYIDSRVSQGVSVRDAVLEWNGRNIVEQ